MSKYNILYKFIFDKIEWFHIKIILFNKKINIILLNKNLNHLYIK